MTIGSVVNTVRVVGNEDSPHRGSYLSVYERSKHENSPAIRDPNAVVYLIPGVGMITSRMLGAFRNNPSTRQEFLSLIGNPGIHG